MTAVTTAQIKVKDLGDDYKMTGSDVDADGEDDAEADYSTAQTPMDDAVDQTGEEEESIGGEVRGNEENEEEENDDEDLEEFEDESESDLREDRDDYRDEEEADREQDEEEEDGNEMVGAVKLPKTDDLESDAEVAADDLSEEDDPSGEDGNTASNNSSSSTSSVAADEWEVASINEDEVDADVANRNNCV